MADDIRDEELTAPAAAGATDTDDFGTDDAFDSGAIETHSAEAFDEGHVPPSSGLLSFYDRLRARIAKVVGKKGSSLGAGTVKILLIVPDIFILLVRMVLDRQVPSQTRALIGGALAYFILPVDLLPEALLGVGGYVDDAVLATAVLSQVFGTDLEPFVRKHWSGTDDIRVVLKDISSAARSLLGESVYERLRVLLEKRGVKVDAGTAL